MPCVLDGLDMSDFFLLLKDHPLSISSRAIEVSQEQLASGLPAWNTRFETFTMLLTAPRSVLQECRKTGVCPSKRHQYALTP